MKVELIPVIEIDYHNLAIKAPHNYPYWDYPEFWDKYNSDCYKKAGFIDNFKPYLAGSSFYRPEITDNNLTKLIIDHTQEMRKGKYGREQTSAFFGGYFLCLSGQDKLFPQCCGDLTDIHYWSKLAQGPYKGFYQGHPEPDVEIKGVEITLNFNVGEFDEHFSPTPIENIINFDIFSLEYAIEIARIELYAFELRVNKINEDEKLNINNISNLLIWGDEASQ